MIRRLPLPAFLLGFFGIYILATAITLDVNCQSQANLFYLSRLTLELETPFFHFLDLDPNRPPLPYFIALLFRSPYAASAVLGALLALFYYRLAVAAKKETLSQFLSLLFFLFYLPLIYVFSQNLQFALYTFLFVISNFCLIRFLKKKSVNDFYFFALLYGLSYFTLYEAIFLLPLYLLILLVCTRGTNIHYRLSLLLIAFLPMLFVFLSWTYLSWLFTGSADFFVESGFGQEPMGIVDQAEHLWFLLGRSLSDSFKYSFVFYLLAPFLFLEKRFLQSPLPYIYFSPLLLLFVLAITTGNVPAQHELIVLPLMIPVVFFFFEREKYLLKTFLPLALVVLLITGNYAFVTSGDAQETAFARAVTMQEREKVPCPLVAAASHLEKKPGKVLLDDKMLHPVIYFSDYPGRFILPYQDNFYIALEDPGLMAEHLVMATEPSPDRVAEAFPPEEGIPGYVLTYEKEMVYIFSKED